jgi:hypothetical protein
LMRNIICRQRATDWMYSLFCGSKQKLKFTFSRNRHYVWWIKEENFNFCKFDNRD